MRSIKEVIEKAQRRLCSARHGLWPSKEHPCDTSAEEKEEGRSALEDVGSFSSLFQTKAILRVIFRAQKACYKKTSTFVLVWLTCCALWVGTAGSVNAQCYIWLSARDAYIGMEWPGSGLEGREWKGSVTFFFLFAEEIIRRSSVRQRLKDRKTSSWNVMSRFIWISGTNRFFKHRETIS